MRLNNFGPGGNIFTKLLQTMCHEAGVIICVQFLEGLSPKICEGQKRPNLRQLSTLIPNISGTDLHIEYLKKLDQPQPLPRWTTETWWTLVHKQKSSRGAYWATQVHIFSGDCISAIRGCCPLKFFINARDWPRLPSAHPNWDGGPPKKFLSWKLKIGLKIQRMRLNNFGAGGNIFTKLLQTTCHEAGVIICVQFLEGLPPKICEGQKTSKFRRDFRQLSTSIPNISGRDLHIEHLKKTWSTATPSTLDERNLVYFGPQTKKF